MDVFLLFLLVGLLAQIVDGALGMAYGVIANTVLLAFGVPPAAASASVHVAKIFTGAASAASHVMHRNIRWSLFWPLAAGGMIGGVVGWSGPLGFVGGLLDAIGGGGWGPTVTSTLVGAGTEPRRAIGTVNTAELLVTVAISAAFLAALLTGRWSGGALEHHAAAVAGLIVGGLIAAPFAGVSMKLGRASSAACRATRAGRPVCQS